MLVLMLNTAIAAEVEGVKISEQVEVGDVVLELNGAGLRKKYFVKVYVGALYLPEKTSSSDQAIRMAGARQINMHFLRAVGADKITGGWSEGFGRNTKDMTALQERLQQFNALFEDMKAGDEIILQYLPDEGTRVIIKGIQKGVVAGEDFMQALLRVWLGAEPADEGLKAAMLGLD
jgi:hypothetical protein